MIDLHFDKTPNCWKIAIMLEEVGAKYRVINYDILAGDHLTAAFRVINQTTSYRPLSMMHPRTAAHRSP